MFKLWGPNAILTIKQQALFPVGIFKHQRHTIPVAIYWTNR